MKTTEIRFKNISDFQSRIAKLWQDQKEGESYAFIFPDSETEKCFEDLISAFSAKGQQGARYE